MSAWIVSKAHIDVLVAAAQKLAGELAGGPDALGQMLWEENHKSINYRYDKRDSAPRYKFEQPTVELSPAFVLKQIHFYEYQSCEHLAWEGSEAQKFCGELQRGLFHNRVLNTDFTVIGRGDDAPWGID